ncbi:MAG: hypothetical protein EP344_10910 [Bacteroidetes bacterium]|nr:MAG: hypothetical protein EP344_10910 [Bacteroidota bacterium]
MYKKGIPLVALFFLCLLAGIQAQEPVPQPDTNSPGPSFEPKAIALEDSVMVTIILRHQQDKNLQEIRRVLEAQGFWDMFPTTDARIISWTIAMGLGHVIVLQVPANSVRRLNLALQNGAWGAYDTDIYLSYDYKSIWADYIQKREEAREDRID